VTIVLNVRKLVSLILSIWLFGNKVPFGVLVGAAVVFLGAGLYALPQAKGGAEKSEEKPANKGQDVVRGEQTNGKAYSNGIAPRSEQEPRLRRGKSEI